MEQEIQDFVANRQLLSAAEKDGIQLQPRPATKGVGLQNSGATCYMNSVVQCMLQVPELIHALKQVQGDCSVVAKELKRLFTFLAHSSKHYVKTADLQSAFGWNGAQKHEQHDAHEFYAALMNALGESSPELEKAVQSIFQGSCTDTFACGECGGSCQTQSTFCTLSADVPDEREQGEDPVSQIPLASLLKNLLDPETLDEDNRWECSACHQKVCATRSQTFNQLPPVLSIHLKRFRFDPVAKKRRKVNVPIEIPKELDAGAVLSLPGSYHLCGVVMHFGTAMGGHYKAYTLHDNQWWDCDDSVVDKLSPEMAQELFTPPVPSGEEQTKVVMTKQQVMAENAYILIYRSGSPNPETLPSSEEVSADNAQFQRLLELAQTRKKIVQLSVRARLHSDSSVLPGEEDVILHKDLTVGEATSAIYNKLVDAKIVDGGVYSRANVRLCRSVLRAGKLVATESFGDRAEMTMEQVGLDGPMLLDLRTDSDAAFTDFSPRDMRLLVKLWELGEQDGGFNLVPGSAVESSEASEEGWKEIIVSGQDKATVEALRFKVEEVFGGGSWNLFAFDAMCPVQLLESGELKQFDVRPGCHIVIATQAEALQSLLFVKNKLVLHFNDPRTSPAYDKEIICSKSQTLAEVRKLISASLSLDEAFHLRRGDGQPQLKDEEKTLEDVGITNGSVLHVQLGKGCNPGEHLIRFEVEVGPAEGDSSKARYVILDEVAVNEKSTVLAMKKQLFELWPTALEKLKVSLPEAEVAALLSPETPNHIRLRDFKGGKLTGPLRDDRIVGRCLLGLADGRRVLVQSLAVAEKIGADDLMVTLRVASYDKKTLSPPIDLCIPRACTVQQLYAKILAEQASLAEKPEDSEGAASDSLPETALVDLAKGFTTGPPLSLKNALKLKWNDASFVSNPTSTVDNALGLRDGSLLVVRGKADWQRAQARVKAKKEATEAESAAQPLAVGTGSSAVRARSTKSSFDSKRGLATSSTEPSLKICPPRPSSPNENVGRNSQDDLPQPSPTR